MVIGTWPFPIWSQCCEKHRGVHTVTCHMFVKICRLLKVASMRYMHGCGTACNAEAPVAAFHSDILSRHES
eukprot:5879963-Amphidinium_carterae.1